MNVRTLLDWLDDGRTDDVRARLADHPGPAAPAEARVLRLIRDTLDGDVRTAAPDSEAMPAGADPDMVAASAVLSHTLAGARALRSGQVGELVAHTRSARDAAPDHRPWLVFRVASLLQACYRFTGEPELRQEALAACGRVADRADRPRIAVPARALMGNIHMLHGALHRTLEHCDAALDLARTTDIAHEPVTAMAHQFRGYVLFEWNRLEEAERALQQAWDVAGSSRGVRSGVARMMAHVRTAAGDDDGADRWLRHLESVVAGPLTLRNREWLASVRARQTLGPGQLRAVEDWLRTYDYRPATLAALDRPAIHARLHELDQVLALLEATEQWTAVLDLAPRISAAARAERCWFAARAGTAAAVALEATGQPAEADARFAEALALGEEGSFVRVFVAGSSLRERLLERALHGPQSSAAQRVRRATRAAVPARLTPAQTAVLEHVAAGASNKTVARALGVSISTVKTHMRAIFARLEVTSRTQAVARARSDGILRG